MEIGLGGQSPRRSLVYIAVRRVETGLSRRGWAGLWPVVEPARRSPDARASPSGLSGTEGLPGVVPLMHCAFGPPPVHSRLGTERVWVWCGGGASWHSGPPPAGGSSRGIVGRVGDGYDGQCACPPCGVVSHRHWGLHRAISTQQGERVPLASERAAEVGHLNGPPDPATSLRPLNVFHLFGLDGTLHLPHIHPRCHGAIPNAPCHCRGAQPQG